MLRNYLLLILVFISFAGATAQDKDADDLFYNAMKENVIRLDTSLSRSDLIEIAANFERIARVEVDNWLPLYYSAFCYATIAYREGDLDKVDEWCDRAVVTLNQAAQLEHNGSEIEIIHALIDYARIQVDFMKRGMEKSESAITHLRQAAESDPANPRAFALMAQHYFNVPVQMGGSLDKGCQYGAIAKGLFEKSKENSGDRYPIEPHWGEGDLNLKLKHLCGKSKNSKK